MGIVGAVLLAIGVYTGDGVVGALGGFMLFLYCTD